MEGDSPAHPRGSEDPEDSGGEAAGTADGLRDLHTSGRAGTLVGTCTDWHRGVRRANRAARFRILAEEGGSPGDVRLGTSVEGNSQDVDAGGLREGVPEEALVLQLSERLRLEADRCSPLFLQQRVEEGLQRQPPQQEARLAQQEGFLQPGVAPAPLRLLQVLRQHRLRRLVFRPPSPAEGKYWHHLPRG